MPLSCPHLQRGNWVICASKNTGQIVWDGAVILSEYIRNHVECKGKNVVELGYAVFLDSPSLVLQLTLSLPSSGTGLVGIVAALKGVSKVVLTDYGEDQLGLLSENVAENVAAEVVGTLEGELQELRFRFA